MAEARCRCDQRVGLLPIAGTIPLLEFLVVNCALANGQRLDEWAKIPAEWRQRWEPVRNCGGKADA
jgi:hypothetical protein